MLPIRDHNPRSIVPVVNYGLIAICVAAWLWEFALMEAGASWVIPGYGMVPARLTADPGGELFTVFTSMFMHGSWGHIAGNMLFLWIFGDNVEDAIGHVRYALFYLVGGLVAAAAQLMIDPGSHIPMIGASGAIAAVLGAYVVLYPRAPVTVFFGFFLLEFPAWVVVGEWFLWNLVSGVGSLGAHGIGGVAFFAHIGGFIAGLLTIRLWMAGRRKSPAPAWVGWRPPPRLPPAGPHPGTHVPDSERRRDPWL